LQSYALAQQTFIDSQLTVKLSKKHIGSTLLRWRSRGVPLFFSQIIEARCWPGYYPLRKRDRLLAESALVRLPTIVPISDTTLSRRPQSYVKEPL
jgi:hypothetical protein